MREIDIALGSHLIASTALTSLLADTTSIYLYRANDEAPLPYVVYFQSAGVDENSSPRRARRVTYTIKAVSLDLDTALQIEEVLDTVMDDSPDLNPTSWGNYRTERISDIMYAEESKGLTYYHVGGQWRIYIAK